MSYESPRVFYLGGDDEELYVKTFTAEDIDEEGVYVTRRTSLYIKSPKVFFSTASDIVWLIGDNSTDPRTLIFSQGSCATGEVEYGCDASQNRVGYSNANPKMYDAVN
eukprot:Trichotokara_eunicae@DN10011_c0_g1_i1.p1